MTFIHSKSILVRSGITTLGLMLGLSLTAAPGVADPDCTPEEAARGECVRSTITVGGAGVSFDNGSSTTYGGEGSLRYDFVDRAGWGQTEFSVGGSFGRVGRETIGSVDARFAMGSTLGMEAAAEGEVSPLHVEGTGFVGGKLFLPRGGVSLGVEGGYLRDRINDSEGEKGGVALRADYDLGAFRLETAVSAGVVMLSRDSEKLYELLIENEDGTVTVVQDWQPGFATEAASDRMTDYYTSASVGVSRSLGQRLRVSAQASYDGLRYKPIQDFTGRELEFNNEGFGLKVGASYAIGGR